MMPRQFGLRNASHDARAIHVMQRQNSVLTRSALDTWDALVTLHYGGRAGICAHFREATVAESGMAWAGGVFAVPAAVTLENSILTATTAGRAFLYQLMAAANHYNKWASVALASYVVGDFVGLRLDDGSDDYYLEVVLRVSQASPTQWQVRTSRRTGGAVTTQDGDTLCSPPGYVLKMHMAGTQWTDWNAYPMLHTNMGFEGNMLKPGVLLGGADLAFTPTRAGIVFYAGDQETSMVAKADWFDIGRA